MKMATGSSKSGTWCSCSSRRDRLARGCALPRPSIDTGMGLERIAAILQGKHDNYDIDIFRALILASAEATGQAPDGPFRVSHRVVADHLRSTAFLIADGVLPSNEGRGYVLRRIMRRAMRHAHMMGAREPVMYRLVPTLVRQMGAAYPELVRAEALIVETLLLEETRFRQTLDRGLHLLTEETERLGDRQKLPGAVAFRLYDTYGFPLDLTQDALREQGREVDLAGFETAMEEQRRRARAAWAGTGEAATERVWFELKEKVGASEFLGYSTETAEAEIVALVVNGAPADAAAVGSDVAVVLNQTPFYGESGGQVGDTGVITGADGLRIAVRIRRGSWAICSCISGGSRRVRRMSARRCWPRWIMRGAPISARIIRRRICCTRRCGGGWARMSRRRAA